MYILYKLENILFIKPVLEARKTGRLNKYRSKKIKSTIPKMKLAKITNIVTYNFMLLWKSQVNLSPWSI